MNKFINSNKKIFLIIGFFLVVTLLLVGTYALYRMVLFSDLTADGTSLGLDEYIEYTKGVDIASGSLNPASDYTSGNNATIEFWKTNNDYNIYGHIYMDINSIGENLKTSSALKYVVVTNGTVIAEGTTKGYGEGSSILLKENINLQTSQQYFTIYLWLDESSIDNFNIENESISATIRCEATMKEILPGGAGLISNLYNSSNKTNVTNFGTTYKYDTMHSLMEDMDGNIRYYGATPNNYIYFNCSDYSDQSSSTCEVWRIIGVFDGKLKLIRGSNLGGYYSWDTSASTVNSGYGINEWSQADLMKLLNPGYENNQDLDTNGNTITVNNSLYWTGADGEAGTCYSGSKNATETCNFTSTGLKNDKTRGLISEYTYYLGGINGMAIDSRLSYVIERGQAVYPNPSDGVTRTLSWPGKIALPNPSDYGYASDLSQCRQNLIGYDDDTCTSNNWMKSLCSGYYWLLTPHSTNAFVVWNVFFSGNVTTYYAYTAAGVLPVLYLNSDVSIGAGDGSSNTPYQLVVH